MVERCVRDAEVAGSNPVASTYYSHLFEVAFLVPATGSGPNFGRRGPWRSGGPPFRADRSGAQTAGSNPVASTYYSHLFEVAFLVPATGSGPNFGRRGPWRSGGPPFRADRSGAQTAGSNPVASTYYSHLFEVVFLVPATGSGANFGRFLSPSDCNQISQSYLAFLTILCYANNKQTVSHHRRIQHEDNRATAHRTQK